MNILVTAGNTHAPIDKVRAITNIFTGRTGAGIAVEAHRRGHAVSLLTSHPDAVPAPTDSDRWHCSPYRTFHELMEAMADGIRRHRFDAVVHSAAVGDYQVTGVFAPAAGTRWDGADLTWHGTPPRLVDRRAAKVRSDESEIWLRLARSPKLVDMVRTAWGFRGILVKFKLEVDVAEAELLAVAERSRRQSEADWMVANTLETAAEYAYLGAAPGYDKVARHELPSRLLDAIEQQQRERAHG